MGAASFAAQFVGSYRPISELAEEQFDFCKMLKR